MLETVEYCPRLLTRTAEMKALLQLPPSSKDLLFPMLGLAPWPNAKLFELTWEKVSEAFANRRFAVDLDRTFSASSPSRPSVQEFKALFDSSNGFENYFRALEPISTAIPVFVPTSIENEQRKQLSHVERLDRGLFFRVSNEISDIQIIKNLDWLLATDHEFVLFVDAGWRRDLLFRQAWVQNIVERVRGAEDRVEVVVCGSSFPDSFSEGGARSECDIVERRLFANMRRAFNEMRMTYGDWGSTRPRVEPVPMNIVPRIDLPMIASWVAFRGEDEDYSEIARRTLIDVVWGQQPEIWGTKSIVWTAEEMPGAIKGQAGAAAARINIHLHRQAQFDAPVLSDDVDEPFSDEY